MGYFRNTGIKRRSNLPSILWLTERNGWMRWVGATQCVLPTTLKWLNDRNKFKMPRYVSTAPRWSNKIKVNHIGALLLEFMRRL